MFNQTFFLLRFILFSLQEISEVMHIALCMSPNVFLHILHRGYFLDDDIVVNAFQVIRQGIIQPGHVAAMSSLHGAGFLVAPCIRGDSPIKQDILKILVEP